VDFVVDNNHHHQVSNVDTETKQSWEILSINIRDHVATFVVLLHILLKHFDSMTARFFGVLLAGSLCFNLSNAITLRPDLFSSISLHLYSFFRNALQVVNTGISVLLSNTIQQYPPPLVSCNCCFLSIFL